MIVFTDWRDCFYFVYFLVNRSNTITSRVARATLAAILDSVQYVDENGGPTFPPLGDVFKNSGVGEDEEVDAEVSVLLLLTLSSSMQKCIESTISHFLEMPFRKVQWCSISGNDLLKRPKGNYSTQHRNTQVLPGSSSYISIQIRCYLKVLAS